LSSSESRPSGAINDVIFEQILLESPRTPRPVDFKADGFSAEINFYENLDQPYITGNITIVDSRAVLSRIDILGGETITFVIKSTKENTDYITKKFYISSIVAIKKLDNNKEMYTFHLKEDVEYQSNLINVNRSYADKCGSIINKIAKDYLDREVVSTNKDKQAIKTIIPNLDPLEAMTWIKNRASTIEGYPFYLYSTLYDNKLRFVDLGSFLRATVINREPFNYNSAATTDTTSGNNRRTILNFECRHTEDLHSLIKLGLIGSHYEYIDITKNDRKQFDFDVVKDLLKPMITSNTLQRNQSNPLYSPVYTHNEKPFNEYQSRSITRIGGIDAFENKLSYGEANTKADYKLDVIADAVHNIMHKAPMTVMLSGYDFMDGGAPVTIGNSIRLQFQLSDPDIAPEEDNRDLKLSGDYLIFSARHIFSGGVYNIELGCVKLGNYRSAS
jgi:hypothetical protein